MITQILYTCSSNDLKTRINTIQECYSNPYKYLKNPKLIFHNLPMSLLASHVIKGISYKFIFRAASRIRRDGSNYIISYNTTRHVEITKDLVVISKPEPSKIPISSSL